MTLLKRLVAPVFVSLALVACGGGGGSGGSDSGSTNPYDADAKYTGLRTQAMLTTTNKSDFIRALYGVEYESFSLASVDQSTAIQERSFSSLTKDLTALALQKTTKPTGYTLAAAVPVSEITTCPRGGTSQFTGEIDNQTGLGTVTLKMTNCVNTIGKANGSMQMIISGYNMAAQEPTAFTLTFQNLKVDYDALSYTAVGTQSYALSQGIETTTSNIHRLNHTTNKQSLIKNYKVVSSSANATTFKLSGQAYLQDYGYVNLSTLENVTFNTAGIPIAGKALLSGAGNSKLRITATSSTMMVELDSNGEGNYEETGYITLRELFGGGDYCVSGC